MGEGGRISYLLISSSLISFSPSPPIPHPSPHLFPGLLKKCPSGLLIPPLAFLQAIPHTSARALLLECKSDHVILLLKYFVDPVVFWIKSKVFSGHKNSPIMLTRLIEISCCTSCHSKHVICPNSFNPQNISWSYILLFLLLYS